MVAMATTRCFCDGSISENVLGPQTIQVYQILCFYEKVFFFSHITWTMLDFWRGARQVRRRVRRRLRRRPVRLCVGYGVGSTQKYKLGLRGAWGLWCSSSRGLSEGLYSLCMR